MCARWQCDSAPRPSHTHISSPSHTLPSSLESFPSPKICKMRNSHHQQCQYLGGVVDSQQNTFAPNLRTVTSETGLWVKLNSSSNLLEPPWNTSERLLTQKLHSSGLQNYLRIQRTIHSSPFITWIFVSKQGLLQVDQLATACGRPGQDGPPVS